MNPRILAISGPLKGSQFILGEADLKIGRGARNNVSLNDPLVSPKHCCLSFEYDGCLLWDCRSEHGTFVNGFSFPAKIVVHGDHIRVGRSVFVYLLRDEVDEKLLTLTDTERNWTYTYNPPPDRAGSYEAPKATTLAALLKMNASINELRSADEIQAHILDFIFQVIPVERAAILLAGHDENHFISSTHRTAGSPNGDAFPIDETVASKVLRGSTLDYQEKAICCPMTTFDTKVGVIYVEMAKSGSEWFTGNHVELLESIAGATAVALEHVRYVAWLEGENQRLNELLYAEHGMIGDSERMKEVYRFISRVGPGERPVLILGPSGTGKELVAYAIHRNSPRSHKRFIPVNCGAFSESLLQSELFGYEKGAFTGAVAQQKGLFEEGDGCTIFLDEIGELPLNMQADLLRVIQEGEIKLLRSIGTSGARRTRKFQESVPKPINCWLHMAGREMFGNSKMPSNGRFLWAPPPTFSQKTCRKRSDRLRMRRFPAKVYMSVNLPPFRNRSSRECSAKPAAIVPKPPGGSVGIRIHSAADAPNSAWNEFEMQLFCRSNQMKRKNTPLQI